jgi:hypothetical protein
MMTQLYVAASVSMLVYYNSIRRRHYVTRSGILPTTASPWRHLYENGDEVSFLNLTGFSREAFEEMHQYLYENVEERYGAGRPRLGRTYPFLSWFYNETFRIMSYFRMHTNSLQCIYQSST